MWYSTSMDLKQEPSYRSRYNNINAVINPLIKEVHDLRDARQPIPEELTEQVAFVRGKRQYLVDEAISVCQEMWMPGLDLLVEKIDR